MQFLLPNCINSYLLIEKRKKISKFQLQYKCSSAKHAVSTCSNDLSQQKKEKDQLEKYIRNRKTISFEDLQRKNFCTFEKEQKKNNFRAKRAQEKKKCRKNLKCKIMCFFYFSIFENTNFEDFKMNTSIKIDKLNFFFKTKINSISKTN